MNRVFPQEIINLSVENHFAKYSKKSNAIYLIILIGIIGGVISAFLLKTDITVQSRGLLRPISESIQITSPIVAEVERCILLENKFVKTGDTLVWLRNQKVQEKIVHLQNLVNENKQYMNDLSFMLDYQYSLIKTNFLKTTHSKYRQKLSEFDLSISLLQKSYKRTQILYDKKVVPLTELEEKKFQLDKIIEEKRIFVKTTRNDWQTMLVQYNLENKKYKNQIEGLEYDLMNFIILAPRTGYIIDYIGIKRGSFVTTGQTIATISPEGGIVAENLVSPKDIGYLHKGMPVIFQIDAYNYNQWGFASGKIIDVSNEIYFIDNQPFFKVKSSLNETHLTLTNGYKGQLKKGLTITARYKITKRSLAQLFFDKTDDWLNPKQFSQ